MNFLKLNLTIMFSLSILFSSEIKNDTEKRIFELFPNNSSIKWMMYQIPKKSVKNIQNSVKQKFFRKEINLWKITDNDSLKYYAMLDNVIGKTMPISFLVIFNDKGVVHNASIIKYREPYGGEVGNKNWLKQFISYSDTSKYKVGDDISAISGATLSVNSVTKGVFKLSLLIKSILEIKDE
mgnify:CR=1 FL=1|tara:strand:+ start:508 stop:1050 length:543 start_codon:yes stop_codon:yes gene_type:complete